MAEKTYNQVKSEVANKKVEAEKPKHQPGSLNDLQNLISDLYDRIDNLNERINTLEEK